MALLLNRILPAFLSTLLLESSEDKTERLALDEIHLQEQQEDEDQEEAFAEHEIATHRELELHTISYFQMVDNARTRMNSDMESRKQDDKERKDQAAVFVSDDIFAETLVSELSAISSEAMVAVAQEVALMEETEQRMALDDIYLLEQQQEQDQEETFADHANAIRRESVLHTNSYFLIVDAAQKRMNLDMENRKQEDKEQKDQATVFVSWELLAETLASELKAISSEAIVAVAQELVLREEMEQRLALDDIYLLEQQQEQDQSEALVEHANAIRRESVLLTNSHFGMVDAAQKRMKSDMKNRKQEDQEQKAEAVVLASQEFLASTLASIVEEISQEAMVAVAQEVALMEEMEQRMALDDVYLLEQQQEQDQSEALVEHAIAIRRESELHTNSYFGMVDAAQTRMKSDMENRKHEAKEQKAEAVALASQEFLASTLASMLEEISHEGMAAVEQEKKLNEDGLVCTDTLGFDETLAANLKRAKENGNYVDLALDSSDDDDNNDNDDDDDNQDTHELLRKPKRAKTAYLYFFDEEMTKIKASSPSGPGTYMNNMKLANQRWKEMDESQRAPYTAAAEGSKWQYCVDLHKWEQQAKARLKRKR